MRKGNQKTAERKDSSQGGCKEGEIQTKTSVDVLRRQQRRGENTQNLGRGQGKIDMERKRGDVWGKRAFAGRNSEGF